MQQNTSGTRTPAAESDGKSPATLPPTRHDAPHASNVTLWALFTAVVVGTDGYFLILLHPQMGWDLMLAVAALFTRAALFVCAGLSIEALLLRGADGFLTTSKTRRSLLHANWIAIMLLCLVLVSDVLVFAFAGYHVPTALKILLSDGPAGVAKVVEATGLSLNFVVLVGVGLGIGVAIAIVLSKQSRRLSNRAGIVIHRGHALLGVFVSLGLLALVEMASYRLRDPFLWERETRQVPFAFTVVRPAAELASFRVEVLPSASRAEPNALRRASALPEKPDVFIVIVESLRKDMLKSEVMPHFSRFASSAWTFDHALTTGNVTHYSWYGLLCSRIPLYFDVAKHSRKQHGSLPLERLHHAGYEIQLFATPDTEYQNLESIIFDSYAEGRLQSLLGGKFRPDAPNVAHRDQRVIEALTQRLSAAPAGGSVYLVALDSTHYDYQWGPDFVPPFAPYAESISIAKSYARNAEARLQVINRYKNSVAWVDSLLGRLFRALERTGRLDSSIIVVTGDHGEAFWEHGAGTHGTDLGREQLEVAFAMKLPGRAPRASPNIFSLLDVMPTILHELRLETRGTDGTPEQRRLDASAAARDASAQAAGADDTVAARLVASRLVAPRTALTFQGWNERAYRFALTTETRRLLFELDHVQPRKARRLVLKAATDLGGASLGNSSPSRARDDYAAMIRDLPAALDSLTFLRLGQ